MAKPGPKPKVNRADSARITDLISQGFSDSQIGAIFGVSRSTICRYRNALPEAAAPEPGTLAAMIARHNQERRHAGS